MKIWKPDTCECEIEEIYEGNTIKGGGQVLHKCAAHAAVADADLYGVLYANPDGENKRKNLILRELLGLDGTDYNLHEDFVDADGNTNRRLKPGVKYNWSFSGEGKDRVLNVSIDGTPITALKRASFLSGANARFGNGKVDLT